VDECLVGEIVHAGGYLATELEKSLREIIRYSVTLPAKMNACV
jgi:hypothetical protein